MLKCLYTVSPRLFHIREGVGTCHTPIGSWGPVNDLCCLVPAPPKYRGGTSHIRVVCFYYVRSVKIHAANIEALNLLLFFVSDGKLFLKISQMLVVCICYSYNFHIFLSFSSENISSQKCNTDPEGCRVDWQDLMMVLGGAVMKEEDL